MAPVRYALLGALALAADGSPIANWARRLSGPSDACKQACPSLEAFLSALDGPDGGEQYTTTAAGEHYTAADEHYTTTADDEHYTSTAADEQTTEEDRRLLGGEEGGMDIDGFEAEALEAMQSLCQFQDVIPCLQENSDVCDVPDDFQETTSHLTCICDLCPGIIEAQVGFATVFVNSFAQALSNGTAGSPPDQDDLEEKVCKFNSCMECAAEHPAECAFMGMPGGNMSRRMTTMMDLMQMPSCPQDATCSASASESTPQTTPAPVSSSKAGEISSHLFFTSLLAVIVPVLVMAK
jgi:hypothetical protein